MTPVLPERIYPKENTENTPHQPNGPQSNSVHHHLEGGVGGLVVKR